ncbi:hypothetical protein EV360DRAFT_66338 [Lentinula raphanica]|nr:hypothetical protein EV360DRAFT_66338 [Lentinula raphanica]
MLRTSFPIFAPISLMNLSNNNLEADLQTQSYLDLAALTFFYYDYFHTLDMEIQFIWARPTNLSSVLFFLNRYFSFLGNIVIFLSIFIPPSNNSALTSYNCYPPICVNIRAMAQAIIAVNSIGWTLVLVYDTLLFGMTLFKAYRARYKPYYGVKLPGGKPSLCTIIIQDGSIYFGVVASVNLINVLSYYDALLRGNTMSTLASCTSVTLMSRLMLHLHEIADQGIYVSHGDTVVRRISRNPQSDDSDAARQTSGPMALDAAETRIGTTGHIV